MTRPAKLESTNLWGTLQKIVERIKKSSRQTLSEKKQWAITVGPAYNEQFDA